MLPNFIVLGPPKCASTSLFYYLGQHPQIFTAKVKEIRFFSLHYDKGLGFYEEHFKNAGRQHKAIGESTPTYSFLPFAADRMKQHIPNAKFILCFRNPMDRAFSSYLMQQGMGKEKLNFRESIDINLEQMKKITLEGEEGAKTWTGGWGNYAANESRLRTIVQGSMYANILKIWLSRFDASQIKVIFIDDLKTDFDGTMKSLFAFLGVDENFIVPDKKIVNFHFDRKASKLTNKLFGVDGTKFLIKLTPKFIKDRLKKQWKTKEPPKLNMEDRLYLWNVFKEDAAELQRMTGRDLSAWNPVLQKETAVL